MMVLCIEVQQLLNIKWTWNQGNLNPGLEGCSPTGFSARVRPGRQNSFITGLEKKQTITCLNINENYVKMKPSKNIKYF